MMNSRVVWMLFFVVGLFTIGCNDPLAEREREAGQIYEDSLAQAILDDSLIEEYLSKAKYDGLDKNQTENGIHYMILDVGSGGDFPAANDILSVEFTGRLLSDTIFDTTIKSLAIEYDSLLHISNGVNIRALMTALDLSLEETLNHLATSNDALKYPLYLSGSAFGPLNFNHTADGSGLNSTFPQFLGSFRVGLQEVIGDLTIGGRAMILIPSAVAYGKLGVASGRIQPNTVITFEFTLSEIRP